VLLTTQSGKAVTPARKLKLEHVTIGILVSGWVSIMTFDGIAGRSAI
jgi:hypothetical protein